MNIFSEGLKPPASSLTYLPQLDTVRAFAVLLVLWHHWAPPRHAPGSLGVWIFFVLSGFLITRILLKSRRETTAENQHALYNFYVRRFLRIFPLYYFVLLLSFFGSALFRADWYWYVTYLQNFKFIMAERGDQIFGTHLWSLAVEEQFYVVWPLLALFAPRAVLLPLISAAVAAAVSIRFLLAGLGWSEFEIYVFTPSNLDTLGLGALLAYFVTYRRQQVIPFRRIAMAAAIATFGLAVLARFVVGRGAYTCLLPLPMGLASAWMVSVAADGVPGRLGRLISLPPLIYIGRISYGVYVYHYFVPIVLRPMFNRWQLKEGDPLFVLVCFIVTMVVASLSWFLLEKPINSLKDTLAGDAQALRTTNSIPGDDVAVEPEA